MKTILTGLGLFCALPAQAAILSFSFSTGPFDAPGCATPGLLAHCGDSITGNFTLTATEFNDPAWFINRTYSRVVEQGAGSGSPGRSSGSIYWYYSDGGYDSWGLNGGGNYNITEIYFQTNGLGEITDLRLDILKDRPDFTITLDGISGIRYWDEDPALYDLYSANVTWRLPLAVAPPPDPIDPDPEGEGGGNPIPSVPLPPAGPLLAVGLGAWALRRKRQSQGATDVSG